MILDTSRAVAARHPLATGHVVAAVSALAVVLAATSAQYGYHRDELYFRMLPPAWGYTDQPPLTPLLAQAAVALFGDSVVALRIVALVCAAASVLILTLVTREVGGSRLAWGWPYAVRELRGGRPGRLGTLCRAGDGCRGIRPGRCDHHEQLR